MADVGFVVGTMVLFFLLGLPASRLLRIDLIRSPALTAPVLGCGLFGIGVTILYRYGVSPAVGGLLMLGLAVILAIGWLAAHWGSRSEEWGRGALCFGLLALAVALVCLAPKWVGGAQFWAFQGNHWDNINYIAYSSAVRSHSFAELSGLTLQSVASLQNDYLYYSGAQLMARPTVGIVLAALAGASHLMTVDVSYSYLALLQTLMLFAGTFVVINVFRTSLALAGFAAAGLTVGFFLQYVVDINAWSQLAAMPLAMLGAFLVVIALNRETAAVGERVWRLVLLTAIVVASVLYFYPEILSVYGPATALLGGAALLASRFSLTVVGRLLTIAAGVGLGVAGCIPVWEGTVGHLVRQLAMASSQPVDWWRYFQRYLFGWDVDYSTLLYHLEMTRGTVYGLLSLPVDFAAGVIGLMFALPPGTLAPLYRLSWKLALGGLLSYLLIAAIRTQWRAWRWGPLGLVGWLGILTAAVCVPPLVFVGMGRYWAAGKALAMGAPLLFIILAAPLLDKGARRRWRAAAALYVLAHLGLGLYRPVAAGHADGIHYPFPPYPSVQVGTFKTDLSWDIGRWRPVLQDCRRASIDVSNPFFDRYLQVYLSELPVNWTTVRPLNSYYGVGDALGSQPQPAHPDCLLTDRLDLVRPWQSVIWLGRDRQLWNYYRGVERTLDILTVSPAAIGAEGLYGVEMMPDGARRWTNGLAHVTVANNLDDPATRLDIAVATGAPTDTPLQVLVNGVTLFEGMVPVGDFTINLPVAAASAASALDIRLISPPFLAPPDTRTLGVLLRHLVLVR